jgi:hypothetical protein
VQTPNIAGLAARGTAEQGIHTAFVGKVDAYRPPDELGFSEMQGFEFRGIGDT